MRPDWEFIILDHNLFLYICNEALEPQEFGLKNTLYDWAILISLCAKVPLPFSRHS